MTAAILKLPAIVRMDEVPALWGALQASLRAEAAQVKSAAGEVMRLSAAELRDFDSSALSLLLSAARLAGEQGLRLQVDAVPAKLQELARVYGVGELLWPEDRITEAGSN
jgi:phospholipid transport system transporter-binding protein